MKRCKDCDCWQRFKKDLHSRSERTTGQCRRSAPVVLAIRNGAFEGMHDAFDSKETVWPVTNQDDWCKKFEQR